MNHVRNYLAGLVLFGCLASVATAAKIDIAIDRNGNPRNWLLIEGVIEKGDFERFSQLVLSNSGIVLVYLASPGGDIVESMRIGKLVRSLYLETMTPIVKNFTDVKLVNNSNNLCASSCFFIWSAGVKRLGRVLGIHRPYLAPDDLKSIGITDAVSQYNGVKIAVGTYLEEMNVPSHYLDAMMTVPPDKIEWIPDSQIRKELEGFTPALNDWMAANCKMNTAEDDRRFEHILKSIPKERSNLPMGEAPLMVEDREFVRAYFNRHNLAFDCERKGLAKQRESVRRKLLMSSPNPS